MTSDDVFADLLDKFKEGLDSCSKPLFLFDADADGLASFLLLYKYKRDGKGVIVSGRPLIDEKYLRSVSEYQPDAIFVLDIAEISEDFLAKVKTPIYWIDHHALHEQKLPNNVHYFNPKLKLADCGIPTSYWAYKITGHHLWIAMTGIISDYSFELVEECKKEYPFLLSEDVTDVGEALFNSPLGTLIKILNFNLKGSTKDSMGSVKVLTRIDEPKEILEQSSSKGRFIYKKYAKLETIFQSMVKDATDSFSKDNPVLVFVYENNKVSLSSEVANELKYAHKDKAVIVGRKNKGKIAMSLRSENKEISFALEKALVGLDAYGGGHPKACGAVVLEDDFDVFVKRFTDAFVEGK